MHTVPGDRRPAIWPWLVMPLIALTAFYCLERLRDVWGQEELSSPPAPAAAVQAEDAAQAATEPK
jgi:hypothetical protein